MLNIVFQAVEMVVFAFFMLTIYALFFIAF